MSVLDDLGASLPVLAAPMAGGPTTPAMVIAASAAGSIGFLAAGYKIPQAMADEIASVRRETSSFGVNVFAPNPVPVEPSAYRQYRELVRREASRLGVSVEPGEPREDDDSWADKIDLLTADPVPVVSVTFGIPDTGSIRALQAAGSVVVMTVTSEHEARAAVDAGADALVVQASAAGGHSGTFTPHSLPLPAPIAVLLQRVRSVTALPLIAAGGIATPEDVVSAVAAGADAVAVGTALLRSEESGASRTHQDALADPRFSQTIVTHAFSGRPARALRNDFTDRYADVAPLGYPAVHHLTSALRRAAAAAGDAQTLHLWAGTGFRQASVAGTAPILTGLASRV